MTEKRVFIRRLFADIAPRYDWFNRLASFGMDRRWRREAVKRGGLGPGQRVLDVCAGTGDLAMLCASEVRGNDAVIGVDFTAPMLARAAQAHACNHQNGVMIHTHLDYTRQSINFLKASGQPLYGPDGTHSAGSSNGSRFAIG